MLIRPMLVADIGMAQTARQSITLRSPCSASLHEHRWARVIFDEQVIAIICLDCGRWPLEIMSLWKLG